MRNVFFRLLKSLSPYQIVCNLHLCVGSSIGVSFKYQDYYLVRQDAPQETPGVGGPTPAPF